ncbi:sodium-dependent proline transporter-like [Haliotis rubra]|uniref:sodium-dependent proline transporter-like n=1 Tax=Haliotis rubra TaxID=36100 RepID=UPI001EE55403|nr:sodium-dependent proline transporter-like [Haliotis rubra]
MSGDLAGQGSTSTLFCCRMNGAFLIPFVIFLVLCGLPLFFLEVCLGQFSGKSALHIWALCPLMKGLGIGMVLLSGLTCAYFTTVLAWSIYYLVRSCSPTLPWSTCGNRWNTDLCVTSMRVLQNHTVFPFSNTTCPDNEANVTDVDVATLCSYIDNADADVNGATLWSNTTLSHTAAEEFWQYNTLGISRGLEEVGHIQWHLALCLLAAWSIIFLSVIKGIHSVGKVVYVTATIPYILLVTLLVQGLMLPGGKEGVLVYLTPDFSRLTDIQVWLEACLQVFYSLGPAWGGLITMASYNDFHNNCLRDAIIATFVSEGTSMFGGLVVFSILGFMSKETGVPVLEVVSSGPGLGYVTYPEVLTHLPVPRLWSFLFFAMLVFVAIDTIFSMVETCISAMVDHYPTFMRHRLAVTLAYCCLSYLTGLIFTTQGGMYMFQLVDWYLSFIFLLMAAFLECTVIAWIYGIRKFCADIEMMIGRKPPLFSRSRGVSSLPPYCW